jgi:hypothetical protein
MKQQGFGDPRPASLVDDGEGLPERCVSSGSSLLLHAWEDV